MYSGFDKDGGCTIGDISKGIDSIDFEELQDSTAAEEILLCQDESGKDCVLTSFIDPYSGDLAWRKIEVENNSASVDANLKVIQMSQMTSMLRDHDRNIIFESAIAKLIQNFVSRMGRPPVVLDIGTGTGLLSLICMRNGAQYVFAAEMFGPLASIAQDVIIANNQESNIMIINGKSNDIDEDSLPIRPDLIVSELLDSALIGESCIPSHADAISRLLSHEIDESIVPLRNRVLPNSGTVIATLVDSEEIALMRRPPQWHAAFSPWRDRVSADCPYMQPLIPLHWDYIERKGLSKRLSHPAAILQLDFFQGFDNVEVENDENKYGFGEGSFDTDVPVISSGTVHGIVLYWEVRLLSSDLDPEGEMTYRSEPGAQNWQDHWQQTVYPLPSPISCQAGDVIRISAAHNCTRIWLSARLQSRKKSTRESPQGSVSSKRLRGSAPYSSLLSLPGDEGSGCDESFSHDALPLKQALLPFDSRLQLRDCTCGWHALCNPDRLSMLNDPQRIRVWSVAIFRMLRELSSSSSLSSDALNVVMDVSDGSMLSFLTALKIREGDQNQDGLSGLKVVSREVKLFSRMFHGQLAERNGLDSLLMLWNGESVEDIAEFFSPSIDEEEEDEDRSRDSDSMRDAPMRGAGNFTVTMVLGNGFCNRVVV